MSDSATNILSLQNISCSLEKGSNIFSNINFSVNEGDILVLQGRSGSGKSTLLKCIAHLILHSGQTLYRGSTPQAHGIPSYRTRVMYVPQRPSLLPGTPSDFLKTITNLRSHKALKKGSSDTPENTTNDVMKRARDTAQSWEIDTELWDRDWLNLSGGEAQRMLIAVAVSLNAAEVLLLDEPTSALDSESSLMVEKCLVDMVREGKTRLKALVWITHSPEQSRRVGSRFIYLSAGSCYESEDASPSPSPYPSTPVG